MEETGNVKALEKALCVLDAVRDADSPLGVNEIAKICGMSAATAVCQRKAPSSRPENPKESC